MAYSKVHSRHELGNLVFYEEGNRQRWVDAIGPNVIKYLNDFGGDNPADTWVDTVVSAGSGTSSVISVAEEGGIIRLDAAGNDNDGAQIQKLGGFMATDDDPIYFGVRWELNGAAATAAEIIMGLCNEDTSLNAGLNDGIYFRVVDGSATLSLVTEDGTSETELTMLTTIVVDTWYTDEFYWDGAGNVKAWHNGALIGTSTANIEQAVQFAVSLAFLSGAAAGESVAGLHVDWVRAIQLLESR